jgi:hypothetical protein
VEDITDLEIHLLNFRDESLFDELLWENLLVWLGLLVSENVVAH